MLLLWSPYSKAEEDIVGDVVRDVCPVGSAVREENGSLVFSVLPSRERKLKPEYDGGVLEPWWFKMARDFVNTVQEENLPYGMCSYVYVCVFISKFLDFRNKQNKILPR